MTTVVSRRPRPPRRFLRAAWETLAPMLGPGPAGAAVDGAREAYPVTVRGLRGDHSRAAARLLRLSAFVIALRDVLRIHGVAPHEATRLVSDIAFAALLPTCDLLDWAAALRHPDPLRRVAWKARLARRLQRRGPDWEVSEVACPDGYGVDVGRCAVAEFFRAQGLGPLCEQVICVQEERFAARYGLRLSRSGTLATGAARCEIRYALPVWTLADRPRSTVR